MTTGVGPRRHPLLRGRPDRVAVIGTLEHASEVVRGLFGTRIDYEMGRESSLTAGKSHS